jgi:hypothetical protein
MVERARQLRRRFTAPGEVKDVALPIVNHPDRASEQCMWTPAIGGNAVSCAATLPPLKMPRKRIIVGWSHMTWMHS